jgi:hypothetical protein
VLLLLLLLLLGLQWHLLHHSCPALLLLLG